MDHIIWILIGTYGSQKALVTVRETHGKVTLLNEAIGDSFFIGGWVFFNVNTKNTFSDCQFPIHLIYVTHVIEISTC